MTAKTKAYIKSRKEELQHEQSMKMTPYIGIAIILGIGAVYAIAAAMGAMYFNAIDGKYNQPAPQIHGPYTEMKQATSSLRIGPSK
jgi:hypothetical protein